MLEIQFKEQIDRDLSVKGVEKHVIGAKPLCRVDPGYQERVF